MKTLKVIVEHAGNNLSAYIDGVPVFTVGDSLEEIKANINEAIEFYLEDNPKPVVALTGKYELIFQFDPQSLLNYYSRIFSY
ncbi:MAG: antitoxin HicB, partial [Alistipes sp.]